MNVFLSWSGELSKEIARIFKTWIQKIFPQTTFFMSDVDLEIGKMWFSEILRELKNSNFCIIFLTRENLNSKWLYWEAGAISMTTEQSRISPFLFNLRKSEIPSPFAQFQMASNNKEEILKLLKSLNSALKSPLVEEDLEKIYEQEYEDLDNQLKNVKFQVKKMVVETNEISSTKQILVHELKETIGYLERGKKKPPLHVKLSGLQTYIGDTTIALQSILSKIVHDNLESLHDFLEKSNFINYKMNALVSKEIFENSSFGVIEVKKKFFDNSSIIEFWSGRSVISREDAMKIYPDLVKELEEKLGIAEHETISINDYKVLIVDPENLDGGLLPHNSGLNHFIVEKLVSDLMDKINSILKNI